MIQTVLWELLEGAASAFNAFAVLYFCTRFCGAKNSKDYNYTAFLGAFAIFAAVIITFDHITYFDGAAIFLYLFLVFIYALLFLGGTVLKKLVSAVIPLGVVAAVSGLTVMLMSALLDLPSNELMSKSTVYRAILLILAQLILGYTLFVLLNLMKKSDSCLQLSEWMLLGAVFAISIIICWFLYAISFNSDSNKIRIWLLLIICCVVVINTAAYFLLVKLSRNHEQILNYSMLSRQYEMQVQAAENLKIQYEEIRKTRHDFANHMNVIMLLNESGKSKEISDYIKQYVSLSKQITGYISTDNDIINALTSSKAILAKEQNIDFSVSATKHIGGVDDVDLCSIVSNLLDNAIEATSKLQGQRQVVFKIACSNGSVGICVKNTINESVLEKNPKLTSGKAGAGHGYGTKIIRDIVKKYHGILDYYEEGNMFCCNIVLYTE